MITAAGQELMEQLYQLYAPRVNGKLRYRFGDKINIDFSVGGSISPGDIECARKFADGMRSQFTEEEATIEQRNSRVIIQPHLI